MRFRFRRAIRIGPFRLNISKRGVSSLNIGPVNVRKGYTPRLSVPLFGGLSVFFGGKRRR